ncbi:hypothetical protein HYW46_04175 [Candidatus Daviesbacteria bacterium]|nr:hypothetical protein [Candidatus Daviesbacteria bacterium]
MVETEYRDPIDTEYNRYLDSPSKKLWDDVDIEVKKLLYFAEMTSGMTSLERTVYLLRFEVRNIINKRYSRREVGELIEKSPRTVQRLEKSAMAKIASGFGA